MGLWVFIVAGIWAIVERLLNTYYPGFLDVEQAGASQAPDMITGSDTAKRA
jgi:hypothetical protein